MSLDARKFTPEIRERFLEVLEDTCSVKHAAEACGVSRATAYHHKKNDLEFSQAWDRTIERALDDLLGTAYVRATAEKSDQVLITLLRFRYGEQMKERLAVQVEQSTGLNPDALLAMSAEDRQALQKLLVAYARAEHRVTNHLEHDDART